MSAPVRYDSHRGARHQASPVSTPALPNQTRSTLPDVPRHLGPGHVRKGGIPAQVRSEAEFEALFGGLELVEPGITPTYRRHPDGPLEEDETDGTTSMYAGVAVEK
ncbi:SAM-dependent methyltransferase [Streptomyces brasiliensis]|uniref:Uncharacterized protein n=1 Tax=Streptomyces brasiliensis TaxID=1954 RepID=A0A917KW66_9ACTN|nr:SAM-dependent methyltransferase [Streptomyces brasiliensis]GGJ32673.1 hypothetical protein GCM10010121_049780 [Streptomyces brasiliensis]